jgi:Fuc2NAc and GlcNAc transferase
MMIGPLELVVFTGTAAGTWLVKRTAEAHAVLDHPNERSSHVRPTPRGGGVAIYLAAVGAAFWLVARGQLDPRVAMGFAVPGSLVALIGAVDDVRGSSPLVRILVHLAAAAMAVWALDPVVVVDGSVLALRLAERAMWVAAITGAVNAFNFMDGIDGLAGMEGAVVTGVGGALLWAHRVSGLAHLSLAVTAACLGFLVWNWQPARIFMGDAGSGFLGFALGYLALASQRSGATPGYLWALLAGVFIADAAFTLARRAIRGERWWSAHRSHAYQREAARVGTHGPVSLRALGLNLVLAALVWGADQGHVPPLLATVLGGALLVAAYAWVERRAPMV